MREGVDGGNREKKEKSKNRGELPDRYPLPPLLVETSSIGKAEEDNAKGERSREEERWKGMGVKSCFAGL